MFEYVRWCRSVEECASGKDFEVKLSTRRYSEKMLLRIPFFFAVSGKQLSRMVFLTVSPRYSKFCEYLKVSEVKGQFLPTLAHGVSLPV